MKKQRTDPAPKEVSSTCYGLVTGDKQMQIYGASQVHGAQSISGPHTKGAPQKSTSPQPTAGGDQLDISEAGKAAAEIGNLPDVRSDLVNRVRSEIASGTYDTAEKFDIAIDRLLDEIG